MTLKNAAELANTRAKLGRLEARTESCAARPEMANTSANSRCNR